MNICMFAKGLPVHCIGGMEIHIQELVEGLINAGHRVTVITTKHPNGIVKEEKGNLNIYYAGDRSLKCTKIFYKESAEVFTRLNKKEEFDIIHSQSTAGRGYVMLPSRAVPIVISYHGTTIDEIKSKINVINSRVNLFIKCKSFLLILKYIIGHALFLPSIKKFDAIIATSNEQVGVLKRGYNYPSDKIFKVFNGVDAKVFKPNINITIREKYGIEKYKIILAVSKLQEQKGIQNIILAMPDISERIKNVKLVIVGDGDYKYELKKIIEKNNLDKSIIFTGIVPYGNLPEYFNACDFFVNPTIRQNGYDLTILEAMACEKPVVVTNIGSMPTVIDDGVDGIFVTLGNINELVEASIKVLENKELALRLGEAARKKIIQKFSIESMVDGTINVYKEVIRRNKEKLEKHMK